MKKNILFLFSMLFLTLFSYSQESVSILSEGTGDSYEIARNNALRYAIEKVYGTFISSTTIITNDILQKDEIYSFSSGAISHFEEISNVSVEGKYSVTLKVSISKQKLAAFVQNKGINVEYDAREFVSGIKSKVINEKITEESEVKIISSLVDYTKKVFPDCIDYEISASEPYLGAIYGWSIDVNLSFKTNKNWNLLNQHINNTLAAIDYNYIDEPKTGLGFNVYEVVYTGDYYPKVSEVIPGSPAAIGHLKKDDKILTIKIGEKGKVKKLKGKARELSDDILNANTNNLPLTIEYQSVEPESQWDEKKKGYYFVYGEKKTIEIKPGNYTTKEKRTNDDREEIGLSTFTLNLNGNNYELRSNSSRSLLYSFISEYVWSVITSYKIEMVAGKYSQNLNIYPVKCNSNSNFSKNNPQYCIFDYYETRYPWISTFKLNSYSGIDCETSPPSGEIYIKNADKRYVAQDEFSYLKLNNFSANFKCAVCYPNNKAIALDAISDIKEFKIIKQ